MTKQKTGKELATISITKKVHNQLKKAALKHGMTLREYTEKALQFCFKV